MDIFPDGIDLYAAGSPCPSYSSANNANAAGDKDARGQLIYVAVDFVEAKRPKAFLLEQSGQLQSKYKDVLKKILKRTRKAGYNVTYKLLNTLEHGLPQNRPRVYVAGVRADVEKEPFAWPKRLETNNDLIGVVLQSFHKQQ